MAKKGNHAGRLTSSGSALMPSAAIAEEPIRRTELLDAAAYLFAKNGYHATSMRELAKYLNIKAGSLYYHISSKDQLLVEVCAIGMSEIVNSLDEAIASASTIDRTITAILKGHVRIAQLYGDYLWCYQSEHVHLPSDASERMRNRLAGFHRKIEAMFEKAIERNEVRSCLNIKTARLALISFLYQFARLGTEGRHTNLDVVADELGELLVNGLRQTDALS
jgi:AcrR family transcriptional regulator